MEFGHCALWMTMLMAELKSMKIILIYVFSLSRGSKAVWRARLIAFSVDLFVR